MVDILIKNGMVIDGSGSPAFRADVALEGEKITAVGNLQDVEADLVIDAENKMVMPGVIDMHSHADMSLPLVPTADSMVTMGVTTVVGGQCGGTLAPILDETREEYLEAVKEEGIPIPYEEWSDFGSYLDYLEKIGISVNLHPLVGQGTIRGTVMGFTAARPSEEQMEKMQEVLEQSMEAGAIGISTGLIYPPGLYATTEELIELTKIAGKRNGYYFSHVRGETEGILDAIREEVRIGKETGASLQHSHYKVAGRANWDKAEAGLALIDEARAEGIDITIDMYPYTAGNTSLASLLPAWAHEGGFVETAKRLREPEIRQKMVEDMKKPGAFMQIEEWDLIKISVCKNPDYVGKFIHEIAEESQKSRTDWVFDVLLETNGEINMIIFGMSEDNVKMQMTHPAMMISTDGYAYPFEGPLAAGSPHPRSFGTYPRVLGKYVREEKVLKLEEAVWKMSGFPAQKLRLKNRGLVREGYYADLVIFDAETIIDKADYVNPFQKPEGIDCVFVNGKIVVKNNQHSGERPGKITSR